VETVIASFGERVRRLEKRLGSKALNNRRVQAGRPATKQAEKGGMVRSRRGKQMERKNLGRAADEKSWINEKTTEGAVRRAKAVLKFADKSKPRS
jgi:hypothetical protein